MSDEGKGLLEFLESWFVSSHRDSSGRHDECEKYDECKKAFERIQSLIQQKPEIDKKYVEEKARKIFVYPWENLSLEHLESIITQIISDVRGGGK